MAGQASPMRFWTRLGVTALACLVVACDGSSIDPPGFAEAEVRYLDHAGWLVRTPEHTLIFDYTGPIEDGALDDGTLSRDLLADRKVVLFVSHAHGDHFRRDVLHLRESVEDLVVVMGWDEPDSGEVVVPADGEWTDVSGARVFALHHEFDGIPEGFFLVRSGGLTVYHSGDHGTWSEPPNETFRANIDRMAAAAETIDIAFISAFGPRGRAGALNQGDIYSLETLEPRVTFPMHGTGREYHYAAFADEVFKLGLPTTVGVAAAPGARFVYRNGELHEPANQG